MSQTRTASYTQVLAMPCRGMPPLDTRPRAFFDIQQSPLDVSLVVNHCQIEAFHLPSMNGRMTSTLGNGPNLRVLARAPGALSSEALWALSWIKFLGAPGITAELTAALAWYEFNGPEGWPTRPA